MTLKLFPPIHPGKHYTPILKKSPSCDDTNYYSTGLSTMTLILTDTFTFNISFHTILTLTSTFLYRFTTFLVHNNGLLQPITLLMAHYRYATNHFAYFKLFYHLVHSTPRLSVTLSTPMSKEILPQNEMVENYPRPTSYPNIDTS